METAMNRKNLSRRDFLKITGATLGGTVLACSGLGYAATRVPDFETPAITYESDSTLNKKILITYATRAGSTPEIATAIGEVIASRGFTADVRPVRENPSLYAYQAVIIGSAIRMGAWLPEAVDFVKMNQYILNRIPCAIFTAHMLNTGDDETSRRARLVYTAPIREMLALQDEVFFTGEINYSKLSILDRVIAKAVERNTGLKQGDLRDWNEIRNWANTIFV